MKRRWYTILLVLISAGPTLAQPQRPAEVWPSRPAPTRLEVPLTLRPAGTTSFIQALVDGVSGDSLLQTIRDLQDFGTRYEYTPQRDQAAAYLIGRFRAMGYEPESDWYATGINTFTALAADSAGALWAVDTGGNIVRSSDHGTTWKLLSRIDGVSLQGITLLSDSEAWVCGTAAALLHTRDGGLTWSPTAAAGASTFYDIALLPSGAVLACGWNGILFRKEKENTFWNPVPSGTSASLMRLRVLDEAHVWCCGASGTLLFSEDGGRTWRSQRLDSSSYIYALFFISPSEGWAAGSDGLLLHTLDGGEHWARIETDLPASLTLRDLYMSDPLHGRLVTNNGKIITTQDGGWTWREELSLLNLGWGPNLRRIIRLQDGMLVACGSQNVLMLKEEGNGWGSRTNRLPEGMIHTSRNILAVRKGTATPEKEVVLVAHYDSYSDDRQNHAPGANDNGSGTSAVVEAARQCREYNFGATLKFLLVSGEELGMYGSTHYVRQALAEERTILAAVNGDMIGYPLTGDPARLVVASYLSRSDLVDSALVYNHRYGIGARLQAIVDSTGASDYGPFGAAGYRSLDIAEGTAEEIWGGLDPYYHKTTDTADKVSTEMIRTGARIMLATAAEAAGVTGRTGISGKPAAPPQNFTLEQNYPNPFNSATRIDFSLPAPANVRLTIYSLRGEEVATLLARHLEPGRHSVRWDGAGWPSGIYFCRLVAEGWYAEKRLMLIR